MCRVLNPDLSSTLCSLNPLIESTVDHTPHSSIIDRTLQKKKKRKQEKLKKKMVLCDATSYIYIDHLRGPKSSRNILNRTNISSFPYLLLMKSAREAILEGSDTSS